MYKLGYIYILRQKPNFWQLKKKRLLTILTCVSILQKNYSLKTLS